MATTTTITPREGLGGGFARIASGFRQVVAFLDSVADAHRCSLEAQRLMALSDEQLAGHGLKREEIVHHAFRRVMQR